MQGERSPALKKHIKQNLWKLMTPKYLYTILLNKHTDPLGVASKLKNWLMKSEKDIAIYVTKKPYKDMDTVLM